MQGSWDDMMKDYILAELRCALLRTRTAEADLVAIGQALKMDLISPRAAAERAREVNACHLGAPVPFIDDEAWSIESVGPRGKAAA